MAAVKYVELNPVRAGLVSRAEDYPWSSARSHVWGVPDPLLAVGHPFPDPSAIENWSMWLSEGLDDDTMQLIRRNTRTGRPTGSEEFSRRLEEQSGRRLIPEKVGRKRKKSGNER